MVTKERHLADVVASRDPGGGPVGCVWSQSDGTVFARWAVATRPKARGHVERTFVSMDALRASLPKAYELVAAAA